jgi:hypothetical protein
MAAALRLTYAVRSPAVVFAPTMSNRLLDINQNAPFPCLRRLIA